jgi:hypothetical protein
MSNSYNNKSPATPDFGDGGKNDNTGPLHGAGLSRNYRDQSQAWPLVDLHGAKIGGQLAALDQVEVRVHAGMNAETHNSVVLVGTLRKRCDEFGVISLDLAWEQPLPSGFEVYALYSGQLHLASFTAMTLGRSLEHLVQPPPQETNDEFALALTASSPTELRAEHATGELVWDNGRLTIRLDRPPLSRELPIVVETRFVDSLGELQTFRKVIELSASAETPHGWQEGVMESWIPVDFDENFEITARPLRADELDLLDSRQLRRVLARQEFAAIPLGSSGRFTARLERQTSSLLNPASDFFLRVARKEVVA